MLKETTLMTILTIRGWSGRKYDRKVTKDVDNLYNADNAGRYNKILIDSKAIGKVASAGSKARDMHYSMTMPWLDNGARLLPAKMYLEYVEQMGRVKDNYNHAVQEFLNDYDRLVLKAQQQLGNMFRLEDYPSLGVVTDKFGFDVSVLPIPTADDIRINLSQDDIEKIRDDANAINNKLMTNAMADIWTRLVNVIKPMATRLADPDKMFRNTLMTNIEEMCNMAEKLNFTEDETLYAAIDEIRYSLVVQDVDDLRKDKDFREETVILAKDILDRIAPYAKVVT